MLQPPFCAIILAGGKSRRMGQDKALLAHQGTTFLEQAVAVMRTLTPNVLIVADVADKYAVSGARIVADRFLDTGPVGGIVTGLLEAGPGAHYVVPCDMPALHSELLARLHTLAAPEYDAVIPLPGGGPEPLVAVYRDSAAPKLLAYLESGRRSARAALNGLNVRYLEEEELRRIDKNAAACFTNINTPEDLADFKTKRPL